MAFIWHLYKRGYGWGEGWGWGGWGGGSAGMRLDEHKHGLTFKWLKPLGFFFFLFFTHLCPIATCANAFPIQSMTCQCSANESVMPCNQSDGYPAALCVYSSDDYYEYGHSGESYDSYGEFLLLLGYPFFTCCLCYNCNANTHSRSCI